jgi:hypothetical protein
MLSKNFLTGKTGFTLGTGILIFTAKVICTLIRKPIYKMKLQSQELLPCPHFKIKLVVFNISNSYYLYKY